MDKILQAIEEKVKMGYGYYELEVTYGYMGSEENEGYYLSKININGSTPITDILAIEEEIVDERLIEELDTLGIAYCF